jgi:nitrogen fixation/metabolism regulation signal transduction histidine kinase
LPRGFRLAFVLLVGGVVMSTTLIAILVSRRTTRRLDRLVEVTREAGEGHLDVRAGRLGDDELGDLAAALDQMLVDFEKSRAEIEYLQKIGAWQEVARRLAHEIKNPLTPIQLAIQQLHTKYDGSDARFQKLLDDVREIVTEEVAGLRRLVDDFRGFAKLPRVEAVPLDLALVVEDARRELEASGAIQVDAPARPVMAFADRLLLKRALVNLADNAREAGAKTVRVGWIAAGDTARIVVDDDGPGVPAELREKVFDPYVTTKEHGTGLGLAIVKKTLLEHRGDVELAQGPSPLGGARFELTIPGYEQSSEIEIKKADRVG